VEKIKDAVLSSEMFVTGYHMTCRHIPKSSNLRSTAATTLSLPKPEFLCSVLEGTFALDLTYSYTNKNRHVGNLNLFLITIAINQAPQKAVVLRTPCPIQILLMFNDAFRKINAARKQSSLKIRLVFPWRS
jgi:hypothetical protein